MIVETFNSEVVEQPALGVMLKKNFTEPVYQKIGRVRALNFNPDLVRWLDRRRVRNQMRHGKGSVHKHFRKRGSEGFKSNVGSVLKNVEARHGVVGKETGRKMFSPYSGHTVRLCFQPIVYHTGDAAPGGRKESAGRFVWGQALPGPGIRRVMPSLNAGYNGADS